jgi:hypothetical protein
MSSVVEVGFLCSGKCSLEWIYQMFQRLFEKIFLVSLVKVLDYFTCRAAGGACLSLVFFTRRVSEGF